MNDESLVEEPDGLPLSVLAGIARDVEGLWKEVGTCSTIAYLIGLAEGTILVTAKSSDFAAISQRLVEIMLLLEKLSAFETGQREH